MTKDHEVYCGIYKITNRIDGKCYIGQSIDILYRWDTHFNNLMNHSHKHKFYDVMWEVGLQNFDWEIIDAIEITDPPNYDELNRLEIMYIEKYNSFIDDGGGYNMTRGGLSKGCSEETSKKISMKAKERDNSLSLFCNPQFHKEMAEFRRGKPMTMSARINMSYAQKGREVTATMRANSSVSHTGKIRSESSKKRQGLTIKINKLLSEGKGVKVCHDDGKIEYYVSLNEAARLLGGCYTSALSALKAKKDYRPPKRTFSYSYCSIMDVLCNRNDLYLISQPNAHDKLYSRLSEGDFI